MKRLSFLLIFFAVSHGIQAQIKAGSNPTTIGNGQLLELEKNGQRGGLKLAAVALTSSTDNSTINIAPTAVGTLVWNPGTGGLSPAGIYVWLGSAWAQAKTDNIFTADGSLSASRTMALGTHTMAFTSTATTGTSHFTVDGTTLNVDANNNRVGIGTAAPVNNLEVNGAGGTGTGLRLPTGAASGKILTSDAAGNASWQTGSVVIYSEIHGTGNSKDYSADAKLTDLNTTKADNVKALYGTAYGWDNTNKRWVAPFSGKFRVTINGYFNPMSTVNPRIYAYRNGTTACGIVSVTQPSGAGDISSSTSAIISLNAGEYVEF
ncbi:MAG TPA: hypothetical protein VGB67_10560, partial [Fibrella sp.]